MPVLAPGLADVLVAHPLPAVLLGRQQHLLDLAAVLLLDVGAVAQRAARVLDPARELVAHVLQLAQAQQARPAGGGHGELHALARPARHEQRRQLALEPLDLVQQGAARGTLVDRDVRREAGHRRGAEHRIRALR
jgi:hypothetical protein